MKNILFFAWCLFLLGYTGAAFAQKLYPLRFLDDSVRFQLVVREGRLALQWVDGPPVWQKGRDFPEIQEVRLEESDLMVEYAPVATSSSLSFRLTLRVSAADGPIVAPADYDVSETPAAIGKTNLNRQTWQDAAETLFVPGRTYTLHLHRDPMGAVNCTDERPQFALRRQLPYYGVALAGVATAGIGLYLFKRSDDSYNTYKTYWADARSGDEANEFLDDAKDFKKTGQALLYGGLAVAGIDAALYYLKLRKIRRKQKLYDDFCVPKTSFLTLRPLANPLVSGRATLGAHLEWRF